MKKNTGLAAILALVMLSMPAVAQSDAPLVELTGPDVSIAQLGLTVDQTIGKEIYDAEGNLLANVSAVLGDDGDTPTMLAVEVNGEFVLLDLAQTELINNRIVTNYPTEGLAHLPAWER